MELSKTEIMKILYKENPIAKEISVILSDTLTGSEIYSTYVTETSIGDVHFIIPHSDMGENRFRETEQAKLLSRWISRV